MECNGPSIVLLNLQYLVYVLFNILYLVSVLFSELYLGSVLLNVLLNAIYLLYIRTVECTVTGVCAV